MAYLGRLAAAEDWSVFVPQWTPTASTAAGLEPGPKLEDWVRCQCRVGRGGLQCARYTEYDPDYQWQICENCYYPNRADRRQCTCNCRNCQNDDANWSSVEAAAFSPPDAKPKDKHKPAAEDTTPCVCDRHWRRGGRPCRNMVAYNHDNPDPTPLCWWCSWTDGRACYCNPCRNLPPGHPGTPSSDSEEIPEVLNWDEPVTLAQWLYWGNISVIDFCNARDPPDTGGASSSTDAWTGSFHSPSIQHAPRLPSGNFSVTEEHPTEQLPFEEPAGSPCTCDWPCLFFHRPAGCRNGNSCRFCHAWHPARVGHERPSKNTRKRFKDAIKDSKEKGADLSFLEALARVRPYIQRLLAQDIAPVAPDEAPEPTPTEGEQGSGQDSFTVASPEQWLALPGAAAGYLNDDSSGTDSEMERFFDSLAS